MTDIVDSTATLERLGDPAWRELLLARDARLRDVISTYRGREVTTTGDGFLVVFDGATNAVRCGAAMISAARPLDVEVRVGIHTGEVKFIDENARGVAVHAAARILAIAGADEVVGLGHDAGPRRGLWPLLRGRRPPCAQRIDGGAPAVPPRIAVILGHSFLKVLPVRSM